MNKEVKEKILRPYRRINLVSKKFGRLEVLSFSHSKENHSFWNCQCDCGNTTIASTNSLHKGKTKSCGCICKEIGNKHFSWKGHGEISKVFFNNIKKHAREKGREFNISIEYIWDLFLKQNKKCAYSGRELNFPCRRGDIKGTASLDRIDSREGYIQNNVQWIHKTINTMKSDISEPEFLGFCNEIARYKSLDKITKTR